jgi:glutamate carboxypeptidase
MDPRADPACLLAPLRDRYPEVLASIAELVNIDSGSFSADGVNRVADLCQARFRAGGWTVERHPHRPGPEWTRPPLGDMVVGRRAGRRPVADGGRRLLLLAHMDTVFDDGTAAARPFRTRDGRAYGPGVTDDKAGVVCGFEAVEVLCDRFGFDDFAGITLVCSPDEEIGSPFSRQLIERLAGEHDVAVGLEAARTNGALVSAR